MNTKLVLASLASLFAMVGTSVAQATPRALADAEISNYIIAVNQRLIATPMTCVKDTGGTYKLNGIDYQVMPGSWVDASGAQPALSLILNNGGDREVHMFKLTADFKMITEIMVQNQSQKDIDHGTIVAPHVTRDWVTNTSALCTPSPAAK